MNIINRDLDGKISEGIAVFNGSHPKKILHNLVSSQLDMDRLDYLNRDSFFTGVIEGKIGCDRIIKMLTPCGDTPAVEGKGIYSIENFLIARRLMYWQVYLHKTVVVVEEMLKRLMRRAHELAHNGVDVYAPPQLKLFLENIVDSSCFHYLYNNFSPFERFADLDDSDIFSSIKQWQYHPDKVLHTLSNRILTRNLFKIEVFDEAPLPETINAIKDKLSSVVSPEDIDYFVFTGRLYNKAYSLNSDSPINILRKDGSLSNIAEASDISNVATLAQAVTKYYVCYMEG